jgi:hypothetical protein
MNMCSKPSRDAMRRTAAWVAALAMIPLLHVPPAHAGEVRTTDCLRGFSEGQRSSSSSAYGSSHGAGYGNGYSSGFSGDDRRGFDDGRHRFFGGIRNGLYGGSNSGSEGGTSSGYDGGYSNGSASSSTSGTSSDSCVEIRRELTNPYVIQVQPPQSAEDIRAANERERLWRARCRPVVTQDREGVSRYAYSAPGCDSGKNE